MRRRVVGSPATGAVAARLIRTPERVTPWRVRHDAPLDTARADADGIARVPARAEGPATATGSCARPATPPATRSDPSPKTRCVSRAASPSRRDSFDALGRPVAGGRVEHLGGCSHGTALAHTVADADGVVRFPHAHAGGQLWIEGPGIEAALFAFDSLDSLGARPADVVLALGLRVAGRIVDPLGDPVAGVVVRAPNEQRGPATLTDAGGRFVLDGVDGGREFHVALQPGATHERTVVLGDP